MAKQKKISKAARTYLTSFILVGGFWGAIEAVKLSGGLSSKAAGLLIPVCAYIMMAISLNLVVGFLGELSLGHAAFMSAGAFAGVFFYNTAGAGMPEGAAIVLAFLIGGLAAGIFGVIVGVPVLRLSGDYLAIVTLAFGEILKNVLNSLYIGADSAGLHFSLKDQFSLNMEPTGKVLMKGAMGITGIRKFSVFSVGILLIALTLLFVLNLMNSRAGRAITAIRDDDIAARSIGINLTKYKLMAFVSSAVIAGFAGVLYALNFASLVAKKFDYNLSINILVMVVLGGMGSIPGAIIAAVVLTVLPELLRGFSQYRMFIYSIVLIIMMLFNRAPAFVMWRQRMALKFRSGKAGSEKEDAGKKKG
ncbi:MAG TPA: amino acid ABC transporter permease [Lachnospiraceae bacterium]|jgi:branched-chain amino acid transport system permease protein|nr:amino acid ABC transporter permease [Lachnospiraceae bacterium]HCI83299.1 amino acid ABC transporter permease [Lachnospiraceae bacterium]